MTQLSSTAALTIGQRIIAFNKGLQYTGSLPEGFTVLNPYLDNPETLEVMTDFTMTRPLANSSLVSILADTEQGLQEYLLLTPSTWKMIVGFP